MGTIIVGYDGSDTAEAAVAEAARLAASLGSVLHIVTAVPRKGKQVDVEGSVFTIGGVDEALDHLAAVSRRFSNGLDISHAVSSEGPVEALVKEAVEREAEMIVVGSKRTQGVSRILGSVASGVVKSAPCSVHIAHTT